MNFLVEVAYFVQVHSSRASVCFLCIYPPSSMFPMYFPMFPMFPCHGLKPSITMHDNFYPPNERRSAKLACSMATPNKSPNGASGTGETT